MSRTQSIGGCPVAHEASAPADHHGYEPFNQDDPFPAYAKLRHEQPVMFDDRTNLYVVSAYDDVKAVFDDWETFSSENAQAPVRSRGPQATQIMNDGGFTVYSGLSARRPPEHTRIRAVAQKAFTPRRFKVLEPMIRDNVKASIQDMLAKDTPHADIVSEVAYSLPTITILTLIGESTDAETIDRYKRWSDSRGAMTWSNLSDEQQIPHAHNLVEYWSRCRELVAKAHQEGGDNLTADMVRDQQDGAEIDDHEIASLLYSLLFAGHETTTTLISNAVRVLLDHRDQWDTIVEEPKKISKAIDEVLRYSGSIVAWRRKALKAAKVGGVPIPEGAELLLLMGSANRDEGRFEDGESFDISRSNAREHLSFGFGIHYCLGNMLAKLQTKIALEELSGAIPSLELDEPAGIPFRDNISMRIPEHVHVTWNEA